MEQKVFTVIQNIKIAKDVYKMELSGDASGVSRPGQFVNIRLDSLFLRRPISICDYSRNSLTLIYKKVGAGTEIMSKLGVGQKLDLLIPLGNGYSTEKSGETPLLIGGGVGVPPLYGLCKKLLAESKRPTVVLGFGSKDEVFYEEEFRALGVPLFVTTVDGTFGQKGFVTDAMAGLAYSYFYTCGPMPMFRAIESIAKTGGQYSFEERMGCGFGACMGCSCKTLTGNKRICKEGPVLEREEILWEK